VGCGNRCAGSLGLPQPGPVDGFYDDKDDDCQNKLSENKVKARH